MRTLRLALGLIALWALALTPIAATASPSVSILGTWDGIIDIPGQPLEMVLEFTENDDSTIRGTVDIPVQNAYGLQLIDIVRDGDKISLAFAAIPASIEGTLSPDGIEGTFRQSGVGFPFRAALRSGHDEDNNEAGVANTPAADGTERSLWNEERIADVKQLIENVMNDWNVPGVAVAIIKDGDIVLAEGFGLRDVERNLPVTPNTLFGIGSTTKSFTTAAFQMLADEGALNWDQPIREILPGFRLHDPLITEHISARDFALHRSGLPRHDIPWMFNPDLDTNAFIAEAEHLIPAAGFRTNFIYNNFGYIVLGRMIEQVSGRPWEDIITERILTPLGMHETNFSIAAMQAGDDFAHAYTYAEGQFERVQLWEIGAAAAAGSINSNAVEMAEWIRFHLNKGRHGDEQLINSLHIQQMHSPHVVIPTGIHPDIMFSGYGLGWMSDSYRGHFRVHHGGNTLGYSAQAAFLPRENAGVVVLTNGVFTPLPDIITNYVLDLLLELEPIDWSGHYKTVAEIQSAAMEPSQLGKREGTTPSHPLHEYTGRFHHPTYGLLEIFRDEDTDETDPGNDPNRLKARYYKAEIPLNHWHFDQFRGPLHSDVPMEIPFFFITDATGDISEVRVGMEPTVEPIPFTRIAADELKNDAYLNQFAGEYEALGVIFGITLNNEVLTLHVPGQSPYPLEPMRPDRFKFRDHDGFGVHFERGEDGTVEKAVLIQPHGNIELLKK